MATGKVQIRLISTTPLKFEDVPARNAFEYLQMIYYQKLASLTYIFATIVRVYVYYFHAISFKIRTLRVHNY